MVMWFRSIYAVSKITFLDNLRKQVLQVALILTVGAIGSTTLLAFFDLGVQIKILKDLSLAAILFSGGVMAIAISVGGIPSEIQNHTAYPLLARPIRRSDYLLAKYLGTLATCFMCMALVGVVFLGILFVYEQKLDPMVLLGLFYVFLEVGLIAALGILFSMMVSPMVAATLTFGVFILGQIKSAYLEPAVDRCVDPVSKMVLSAFYHILPNIDSFSFKDAMVHNIPIPSSYLLLVAAYGVIYTSFLIAASSLLLSRKEL